MYVYKNGSISVAALCVCDFSHGILGYPPKTITESPVTVSMKHDKIIGIIKRDV